MVSSFKGQTQNWQASYNATLKFYNNSELKEALAEGEKTLALAINPMEKLYTLKVLSATCNEAELYSKGLEFSKQEIDICEKEAVESSVFIGSLNNLANNYLGTGNYNEAITALRKIVNIGTKIYAANDLDHNLHISDLGYAYYMVDNIDSALYFLSEANSRLLTIDGGAEDYLMNQVTIAKAYYQKDELDKSKTTFVQLKEMLESNDLSGEQLYAETMEGLGLAYYSLGEFSESLLAIESASNTYTQLGFTAVELQEINKQLVLVYLKNEELGKMDSVQALLPSNASEENITINQLSLAYKKYVNNDLSGAYDILEKVKTQLINTPKKEVLLAEYILLNTRVNLKLKGRANLDSVTQAILIFTNNNKSNKVAEAYLVKAKIYQTIGEQTLVVESLKKASGIAQSLNNNYNLKYGIAIELIKSDLQSNGLKDAQEDYQSFSKGQLNEKFDNKLTYAYLVLLQSGGFNIEALNVLEQQIASISYPSLLGFQKVLGKVYLDLGKPQKALETYNDIEAYLVKKGETESVNYGENLAQQGRVYIVLGDYALAEASYAKAIKIIEEGSETPSNIFAGTYNSYAIFQQTIGNYDKAQIFYSKAKSYSKNNPKLLVDIIQNLATLSQNQGAYKDAIILLSEAVATYEKLYGKNSPYYATALQNLANAYSKSGDLIKAQELIEQALQVDKENGLENSISYINKLHNYGVMLQATNQFTKAKEVFTVVIESRKTQLGENHPDYIYSLYNMALLMQKTQANGQAKQYYKEVIKKYDFQINSFFPYLSEEEKSKYYAKIKEAFTAYQNFAAEYATADPSVVGDLYNFQINHKAILLSTSKSMRKTIIRSGNNELISTYENWVSLKKDLAKYYSVPVNELKMAGISIEKIEDKANALEKEISLKSEAFSSNVNDKEITWQTIQSQLTENEASIEIIRLKKDEKTKEVWYAALIITPDAVAPKIILLKNGYDLENKYFKFYINKIKYKLEDTRSYVNYWLPIDEALNGANKIYLSSDGIYNKINVSSFFNGAKNAFILDGLSVHNVTNTSDVIATYQPLVFNSNFNINLIGDPLFAQDKSANYNVDPLPNTRIEIKLIDSLARLKNIEPVQLLDKGANEANLKNMESPNIIHIATHGFFLEDKSQSDELYTVGDNPLMRSGLLLSGSEAYFNGDNISFTGSIDKEDGVLTALEVLNINLSSTDLVVLSACETALGEVKNGEGVYGLQRAFVIAGAKSILMSLWKVDDQTTKELMVYYYTNLFNGDNKFEALDKAQKKLKEKYNNPYYWGAFIISGN